MTAQNPAHLFIADPIAELFQFSGETVITPAMLTGELEHKLNDLRFDRQSPCFLELMVKCPLAGDELAMPAQQRIGFEDPEQLFQLRVWQHCEMSELLDQGQQHELFTARDRRFTFLVSSHDQKLLTEQHGLEEFVIWGQMVEAQTVPKQSYAR